MDNAQMHEDIDIIENGTSAPAPPVFEIDSAERANWLVRKLVECRAYEARVRAFAERERRRAEREERALMRLFGRQLEAWVRQTVHARGGRRKSVSLPAGRVGYRTKKATLVVDDATAVLNWARVHCPRAVVTVEQLSKSALTAAMKETGIVPSEGAHIEPEVQRLFVR